MCQITPLSHAEYVLEVQTKMSIYFLSDLNEGVKRLLLMVLGDDFCQECVLTLGQLDKGANAVNVGVDLDVQDIVFS